MLFAIRDLHASRVNLLMNDFASGLPSPLAFLGLGEAAGRNLGAAHWHVGVLPVLHAVHASRGRTKPELEPDHRSAGSGPRTFKPIETPEDFVGSVRVSLLMDVPGVIDLDLFAKWLCGRRLAGGVIENETIHVHAVQDGSAFAQMPRGYAMLVPDLAERRAVATGEPGELDRLARLLFPVEREPGSGWVVPVAVGHRLLEDPAAVPQRSNTRDPTVPHVFTEPVVGIAELVSIRNPRLTGRDREGLSQLLWRWCAEGEWIVGHSAYHPDRREMAPEENADA